MKLYMIKYIPFKEKKGIENAKTAFIRAGMAPPKMFSCDGHDGIIYVLLSEPSLDIRSIFARVGMRGWAKGCGTSSAQSPSPASRKDIKNLLEQLRKNKSGKSEKNEPSKLKQGDDVVLKDGPFEGFKGKFIDSKGSDAQISIMIFGSERIMTTSLGCLEGLTV